MQCCNPVDLEDVFVGFVEQIRRHTFANDQEFGRLHVMMWLTKQNSILSDSELASLFERALSLHNALLALVQRKFGQSTYDPERVPRWLFDYAAIASIAPSKSIRDVPSLECQLAPSIISKLDPLRRRSGPMRSPFPIEQTHFYAHAH